MKYFNTEQLEKIELGPELDIPQRNQILQILYENSKVIAWDIHHIGKCSVGTFHIETGDARPIADKYIRKSIYETELIKEQVNELLNAGIIEPSRSSWAANALVVPKKEDASG